MEQETPAPSALQPPVKFLSPSDVVKLLGISKTKINDLSLRKINPIPSTKIGRHRRYRLDKVLEWMEKLEK